MCLTYLKMAGLCTGQDEDVRSDDYLSVPDGVPDLKNDTESTEAEPVEEEDGWTFQFLDDIEKVKKYECPICLLPLKDPFLTRCGHNMCKTCLYKQLNQK